MELLTSSRFDIVPASPEFLAAITNEDRQLASRLLDVIVPDSWPVDAAAREEFSIHLAHLLKEATKAALNWAFGHAEVVRVVATIADDNVASQAVARRVGFRHADETHRGIPVWEIRHDHRSASAPD